MVSEFDFGIRGMTFVAKGTMWLIYLGSMINLGLVGDLQCLFVH